LCLWVNGSVFGSRIMAQESKQCGSRVLRVKDKNYKFYTLAPGFGLSDPDPLVRGADPAPDPYLFS
jgi:hypothetical protein